MKENADITATINMRLFLAINFDAQTKKNLIRVQELLRSKGKGNFSRLDNLHLTLAFLGEKNETELNKIITVMNSLEMPKLTLTFKDLKCFDRGDETWWIGIEKNNELMDFQKSLSIALEKAGLYKPERNYLPHITLARRMNIGKNNIAISPFKCEVDSFSLMRSDRVNGILKYTQEYERK